MQPKELWMAVAQLQRRACLDWCEWRALVEQALQESILGFFYMAEQHRPACLHARAHCPALQVIVWLAR